MSTLSPLPDRNRDSGRVQHAQSQGGTASVEQGDGTRHVAISYGMMRPLPASGHLYRADVAGQGMWRVGQDAPERAALSAWALDRNLEQIV